MKRDIKIAIFTDCFLDLTGGIRTSINAQKTALEKDGYEVIIFSTGYPKSRKELEELGEQRIYQVPSCQFFLRGITPVSRRPKIVENWILKNHPEVRGFDVFYVHYEAGCSIAGLRLGKKLGIPTVQVMHGREDEGESNIVPYGLKTIVATILNWAHAKCIPHPKNVKHDSYLANTKAKAKMWTLMINHANYADYIVSPSKHFAEKLKHYGVTLPIRVVPNGYADEKFPKNVKVRALKPGEPLKIIWHSRVSAEKRILVFLEALKKVRRKYQLEVYGSGGDLLKAKRFARKHELKVQFHGNVPFEKLAKTLASSHLDVLASYNFDNYPLTLVEAEAFGVPVLICDPDMREIVPAGGFIMSADKNAESMAEALGSLMEHPEKIHEMSGVMIRQREEVLASRRIKLLERLIDNILQ